MKELESHDKLSEKQGVELQQQDRKKQEFKYENTIKTLKGHSIWEIELKTEEVRLAEFKPIEIVELEDAINNTISNDKHEEVIRRKGCIYISALNAKSALKRYKKNKGSALLPKGHLDITNPFKI